ncbi:MAG: radical SAM protein, partial [Acidimicrobiia bacterium]|nr:radical SAM protein [Acidimicrobiia bacterium]
MMRRFLLIGSRAKTPHPWSFDRRRTIFGRTMEESGHSSSGGRRFMPAQNSKHGLPLDNVWFPPIQWRMASSGVTPREVVRAWGRILSGYQPNLSLEITRECPLRCPGCYAYGDEHLGGGVTLRGLADYTGDELVARTKALVERYRPLHLSIVGGEPLVRFRELDRILPWLAERGVHTQLVTSAVRPIPAAWAGLRRLQIVVSIDGLQPEHDARRTPATYERILRHIEGHRITVHCTVTRQQAQRAGYLEEFVQYWDANPHTRLIWMSLYTPQKGEISAERLTRADRAQVIADLRALRTRYSKVQMFDAMLQVYEEPPASPDACIFARTTACVSADFQTAITPCQFGGNPDCANCGCIASAGLEAIGRHRLAG